MWEKAPSPCRLTSAVAGRPDPEWVRLFKLVGVTDEPTPRLLSLGFDWHYLQPLNERLLNEELGRLAN